MLSTEKAIVCAYLHGLTYKEMHEVFIQKISPYRVANKGFVNKFNQTGSINNEDYLGRPLITSDVEQEVQVFTHSSKSSI